MIYKFSVKDDNGKDKVFYLTSDSLTQFYRRVASTYGILKSDVKLLAEYEETDDYGYKLKKSYEDIIEVDKKTASKAKEIFSKNKRLTGDRKVDYMNRMKFSEVPVEKEEDLYSLLKQYKKVKVYFETGEKRGQRKYYALVR